MHPSFRSIRAYHGDSNLRFKSTRWPCSRPFPFPVSIRSDEKKPSLPSHKYYCWFEYINVWINSLLFLFLLCVFFQFQKSSWLIHCRRLLWTLLCDYDYDVSDGAILTDNCSYLIFHSLIFLFIARYILYSSYG